MTRETLLDKKEYDRRVREDINSKTRWAMSSGFNYDDKKTWTENDKREIRNSKSNIYTQMRNELKNKCNKFWINNGNIKGFLNKFGLTVYNGNVRCYDSGALIIKFYLENVVLPAIEKEIGITNIKLKRRCSALSNDLLDFTQAKIIETTVEENDDGKIQN